MPKKKKPRERLLIGFDLGATKLASGVVTWSGKVLSRRHDAVEFKKGPQGFLRFLADTALAWKKEFPRTAALGIGSCGPLDIKKGVLLQPTNFPRWGDIAVTGPLSKMIKMPVWIQNDAAAAAGAEGWLGGAKKLHNWMTLTLGTGLGTGVVMDHKVFMGGSGLGPEAGHFILTDKQYLCGCGNYGCAEAVLSGTALKNRIVENQSHWVDARRTPPQTTYELVKMAREGDSIAVGLFEEYTELLARAIHNYSIVFNPQKIFFAGGLSEAADLFLGRLQLRVEELLKNRPGFTPKLELTKLREDNGVVAGAWVAHTAMSTKS